MSEQETKVAQELSTKEDNLADVKTPPTPDPEKVKSDEKEETKTLTLQEAVIQLEKLYTEKEEAVKLAQAEATKAQLKLSQCEKDALTVLRQLTPLQNRFLLNTIQAQKEKLDSFEKTSSGKLPVVSE